MSDLMRDIFEKEWDLPSEAQGLRFIPELNIYGCDLYKNKEAADRKSSAWFYFQKAWKASRECLVIDLPAEPEFPEDPDEAIDDSHMDAYHSAIRIRNACRDSIHAAGVKTK